jgi:hypothetical protein
VCRFLRFLGAATLVVASAAPASASARQGPAALAIAVANSYWGAAPCGGHVKVLTRQALPAGLSADSDAWVTFGTPLGANNLAAEASSYSGCAINLGGVRWPTRASRVEDWDMLCLTVVHEYGHLLGHAHDTGAGSVMAPVFTDYSSEPQICRTTRVH